MSTEDRKLLRAMGLLIAAITYGFIAGRWNPPGFAYYAGIPLGISFMWAAR